MTKKFKYYFNTIRSSIIFSKHYKIKGNNKLAAELIRNTHSIEKGLSIDNIRPGFGHKKQQYMIDIIEKIENIDNEYYKETVCMAISSLKQYIDYHDSINYSDDFILKLKEFIKSKSNYIDNGYGGTIELDCDSIKFNIDEIENLFNTRHSIRQFSSKPVDNEIIKRAIKLAQRAPSACNRQGVRAYVVDKSKAQDFIKQLNGIGGFAESLDKLILITGKISSYRYDEINQFIVSSSIYAGYLTLALHAYGLGACVIQRPVVYNTKMEKIKKLYNIEADEQIICMIGVGNIEGKINVPISHRIDTNEFLKIIE